MEEKNFSERCKKSNIKSAADFARQMNADIEFIYSKKSPGKLFFTCGTVYDAEKKQDVPFCGYASNAVQEAAKAGTLKLEEVQYCDMSIDGKPAVPCLMMVGNSKKNVVFTLKRD